MTELYHGPWDPVTGDRPEKVEDDPYHPKYPDAGVYSGTKAWGFLEKPPVEAQALGKLMNVSAAEVKE